MQSVTNQSTSTTNVVVVFDVETTGLPPRPSKYKRYPDPKTEFNHYDNARVVELAYTMYTYDKHTDEQTCVRSVSSLIKPNGVFTIENTFIHGISQHMAETYGKPSIEVLIDFLSAVSIADRLVAHNIEFDYNLVLAECYRLDLDVSPLTEIAKKCTMKCAMDLYGMYRYPKLNDLYKTMFKVEWEQSHRALDDTEKCASIYFGMLKVYRETKMIKNAQTKPS